MKEIAELIHANNFSQVEPKLVSLSSIQTTRKPAKDIFTRSFAQPFIQNSIMNPKALKHWSQNRQKKEKVFNFTLDKEENDATFNTQSAKILSSEGNQSKIPTVAQSEQGQDELQVEPATISREEKGSGEKSQDEQI